MEFMQLTVLDNLFASFKPHNMKEASAFGRPDLFVEFMISESFSHFLPTTVINKSDKVDINGYTSYTAVVSYLCVGGRQVVVTECLLYC